MERLIYIMLCCSLLLTSCDAWKKVVEKPVYIHDTITENHYIHDSIFKHDSTFVMLKGDTIFFDRWHTEYRYKLKTDTVSVIKEIPVEVTITETKEVAKPLTWLQKTMIGLGVCMLITIAVFIVRFYLKMRGIKI